MIYGRQLGTAANWFPSPREGVTACGCLRCYIPPAPGLKSDDAGERDVLWTKLLAQAPFFADCQAKVERQIPMGHSGAAALSSIGALLS